MKPSASNILLSFLALTFVLANVGCEGRRAEIEKLDAEIEQIEKDRQQRAEEWEAEAKRTREAREEKERKAAEIRERERQEREEREAAEIKENERQQREQKIAERNIGITVGADPKLYGNTLDNKEFDWQSLRGKYVLIKFTATWCGPCQREIPGLKEAYNKYHTKGLEIVSVYIWQREPDPVRTVNGYVKEKKLPWIILSETLTVKGGQPSQGDFYGIKGVPTFVLVDKEGKVLIPAHHGDKWKAKLAEIFR
jgi:thiol-disulfide isomerase/thioredoxin